MECSLSPRRPSARALLGIYMGDGFRNGKGSCMDTCFKDREQEDSVDSPTGNAREGMNTLGNNVRTHTLLPESLTTPA